MSTVYETTNRDINDSPSLIGNYPPIVGHGESGLPSPAAAKPDPRNEGAYVVPWVYSGTRLYKIERVNGNATVDSISFTRDECLGILESLTHELLAEFHRESMTRHGGVDLSIRTEDSQEVINLKKGLQAMMAQRNEAEREVRRLEAAAQKEKP